jgi:type I restriction enzyme M protein
MASGAHWGKTAILRAVRLTLGRDAELAADPDAEALGSAYEYLIGQFAAGSGKSGKKVGEFYKPQQISSILSAIVMLDSQEPKTGRKKRLESLFDFACGSGTLLLKVRRLGPNSVTIREPEAGLPSTGNARQMRFLARCVRN